MIFVPFYGHLGLCRFCDECQYVLLGFLSAGNGIPEHWSSRLLFLLFRLRLFFRSMLLGRKIPIKDA